MNQPKKNKNKEPELLEESYIPGDSKGDSPPYIYLLILAFIVGTIIWKGVVRSTPEEGAQQTQRVVTEREVADTDDMVK